MSVVEAIVGSSNPAMTRHYTHVFELAAGQAVAALSAVMGDTSGKPSAPATPRLVEDSGPILADLESMTARNWKAKRDELLVMLTRDMV